ncbi:hypothetical protein [Dongia deserti]|uniref:hypothetical protein n=1 Tax=Dongia deserti TaxID=2268030 RepID=UPI0013C4487A|nr:hypothetical protein [Dongia deserti]
MNARATSRSILTAACILAAAGFGDAAAAEESLREVFFHDLAKVRSGNMIIVQTNPETEILVFNGGELVLEDGNLIVVARHARIDADTTIRSFTLHTKPPKPGEPNQAARGADGMNDGDRGGNGAPGGSGVVGDDGAAAGKVVLRIGEIAAKGRLIVDVSGQGGGKGQDGGQGGDGGNGRNGRARVCGGDEPQDGGDGGWGGIGGQGGPGGRGGNGGIVVYSEALAPLFMSKHFVVTTTAGAGGAGGNPGEAGNPGKGGLGGAGIIGCGTGGVDGAPGRRTTGAQPGSAGAPGTAGVAVQEQAP